MSLSSESVDTAAPEGVATQPVGQGGIRVDISETRALSGGPAAGLVAALAALGMIGYAIYLVVTGGISLDEGGPGTSVVGGVVLLVVAALLLSCLTIVVPGMTSVRQFFGRYIGTVRRTGLVLVPPLTTGTKASVRVRNFETHELKVNDLDGNPINIAAIVVWQVADTARAVFAVEEYEKFIKIQAEAALRHVATVHPYDQPKPGETSLRGGTDEVSAELAAEVAARVAIAGLEIVEVRISSLAYAPEIAQAMLQRQQASAIIAAREQIVEGAVTMVQQALTRLEEEEIVIFDDERRAQMVSNLLVVLTSEQRATPILNAGSLYS